MNTVADDVSLKDAVECLDAFGFREPRLVKKADGQVCLRVIADDGPREFSFGVLRFMTADYLQTQEAIKAHTH